MLIRDDPKLPDEGGGFDSQPWQNQQGDQLPLVLLAFACRSSVYLKKTTYNINHNLKNLFIISIDEFINIHAIGEFIMFSRERVHMQIC